jgi:hypothetical protein
MTNKFYNIKLVPLMLLCMHFSACSDGKDPDSNLRQEHIFDETGNLEKIKIYSGDTLIKMSTYDEMGNVVDVQRSFLIRQKGDKSFYHVVLNMEEVRDSQILHFGTHKVNRPITFELCALEKTNYPKPNYCAFNLYYNTKEFRREIQFYMSNVHSIYELRDTLIDNIDSKDSIMEFSEPDRQGISTGFTYVMFYRDRGPSGAIFEDMHAVLNAVKIINDFCVEYTITPLEPNTFNFYPIFFCHPFKNRNEVPDNWQYFPDIPPPTATYKFEVIE